MPAQLLSQTEQENRWQSRLSCTVGTQVEVRYEFLKGEPVIADVVDLHKNGCGLSLPTPLETGASVLLTGLHASAAGRRLAGRIVWCRLNSSRGYRAGVSFFQPLAMEEAPAGQAEEPVEDHYETLEISPSASEETVHYMFRLLEHRYHPQNPRHADAEKLALAQKAYAAIGNAASRAVYDQQRAAAAAKLARQSLASDSDRAALSATEKSKRWDLLALLYDKRIQSPSKPGLTLTEVEAAVGLLKDDVDFAFWYLVESGLAIPDHGHNRYSISVKGVDYFEQRLDEMRAAELRGSF